MARQKVICKKCGKGVLGFLEDDVFNAKRGNNSFRVRGGEDILATCPSCGESIHIDTSDENIDNMDFTLEESPLEKQEESTEEENTDDKEDEKKDEEKKDDVEEENNEEKEEEE